MITAIRSYAFSLLALIWTVVLCILYLPLLATPRHIHRSGVRFWARGLLVLLAAVCGLRHRVEGRENVPEHAAIIAAKHQSAWETIALAAILDRPVFILKKELLAVPLIGWHFRKAGNIPVDRAAGAKALRGMVPAAEAAIAAGHQVIVFPEGTRVGPGESRPYQPGIAALYARIEAPVIPAALDSGRFWPRRSVLKHSGTITLSFLPAMPEGLDRRAFMAELEARLEGETRRLLAQAGRAGPNKERTEVVDGRSARDLN
ncbi:MAG: 1-acyl-sn-glycerol-3-phosphate acyltransferase [Rhodospirillales bacterium]|jgi:1-acyl-sn-glycerol-3-phosphate acyltransferase|nr:1-acyl-sn-glycerol-3-phosphate acyltransferase [Rhodospirillales bacterium]